MNHKVFKEFLCEERRKQIIEFVNTLQPPTQELTNTHIKNVGETLKGFSYIYDITKTDVSKFLSEFQSDGNIRDEKDLPKVLIEMIDEISKSIGHKADNVFIQIIIMNEGGRIKEHYDTAYPGYVNYKCNISLSSEDYTLFTHGGDIEVSEGDLYCFEASLYKHWTKPFTQRRLLLSYGFGLTYGALGWNENDPRVRLSNRIINYFRNTRK